jgi:hypothetical protein
VIDVVATRVADFASAKQAGDFFWATDARLHFKCPCGCGALAGVDVKPHAPSGWEWNGDRDKPTVQPSISIDRGHWHGYLTNGVFRSC